MTNSFHSNHFLTSSLFLAFVKIASLSSSLEIIIVHLNFHKTCTAISTSSSIINFSSYSGQFVKKILSLFHSFCHNSSAI
ncbi:MAG: hypothetical protein LBQ24_06355 [Candidatus Peribacteria bacterium]|nr:hypothetical protein [Candidatus Peribacteria bacterium]